MLEGLGEKLKEARKNANLTQKQVSERLGFKSDSNVSFYETTNANPNADVLAKLCDMYNVSSEYVLGLDGENNLVIRGLMDDEKKAINHLVEVFRSRREQQETE